MKCLLALNTIQPIKDVACCYKLFSFQEKKFCSGTITLKNLRKFPSTITLEIYWSVSKDTYSEPVVVVVVVARDVNRIYSSILEQMFCTLTDCMDSNNPGFQKNVYHRVKWMTVKVTFFSFSFILLLMT